MVGQQHPWCRSSKVDIKNAIFEENKKNLVEAMESLSKIKDKIYEGFERKDYFKNKNVTETRTMFRVRTGMCPKKKCRNSIHTLYPIARL